MLFGLIAGDAQAVHQAGMELYFESSVMILTLITLGKFLESRAKGKTGEALRKLMALAPDTATVIRDGETLTVPLNQVRLGERVQVKPASAFLWMAFCWRAAPRWIRRPLPVRAYPWTKNG